MAKSKAAALKALELDPNLAEAHTSLALVQMFYEWDWSGGERGLRRAKELNPGYAFGHLANAWRLAALGRQEEALVEMREAKALDPLRISPLLAGFYARAGDEETARRTWGEALELDPHSFRTHRFLGNFECANGRFDEGIAILTRARELGDDSRVAADLAYCYAASGDPQRARELLAEIEVRSAAEYVDPALVALVHVGLEEEEEAFQWLERAYEIRAFALVFARYDSRYAPLRSDPRFDALFRRMGLPEMSG